jgi:hypothetical protein
MKIFFSLSIFLSIIIIIFLLPLYILVWQEQLLVHTVISTHEQTLSEFNASQYSQQVIWFLKNKSILPDILLTNENQHMQEVKNLYILGQQLLIGGGVILFLYFLFFRYIGGTILFFKSVRFGSYIAFILLFIFGVLTLLDFTTSFLYFHHIFFPQGNFLFPENTLLIQIFTERFFKDVSGILWLMSFGFASIMVVVSLPRFHTKSI